MFTTDSNMRRTLTRICKFLVVLGFIFSSTIAYSEEPLSVEVGLKVNQITGINQREENFSAVVSLLMEWHEPGLQLGLDASSEPRVFEALKFKTLMSDKGLRWPVITFHNLQGRIAYQNQVVVVDNMNICIVSRTFYRNISGTRF